MEDPGDPLSAIILAILCNRQGDRRIALPRKEYEQIDFRGMTLELKSTPDIVSVQLVPKR